MSFLGISEVDHEDKMQCYHRSDDGLLMRADMYLQDAVAHAEKVLSKLQQKHAQWSRQLSERGPAGRFDILFWPFDEKSMKKRITRLTDQIEWCRAYLVRLNSGRAAIVDEDLHTTGQVLKEASRHVPSEMSGLVTPDILAGITAMFMSNCADELLRRAS